MKILIVIFVIATSVLAEEVGILKNKKVAIGVYTNVPPKIDGRVDDCWTKTYNQKGFIQRTPNQGQKATYDTRFYVLYDEHNLYLLFFMIDPHPDKIPARLVERDFPFDPDDHINFYLDTYNDHQRAYFFSTNPYGVERDGLISDNGNRVDMSWDGVFEVATRRMKFGWIAEFAIPFKNLRFDDKKKYQIWGFNAWRVREKDREVDFWNPVDQNYGTYRLDRGGILILRKIKAGHHLDVIPYATTRQNTFMGSAGDVTGDVGLDTRYGITSDLTLNMTINPDFSQVEIDEEQINLDKRFELFLPEKRPFFLENTNLFQLPIQTFYSRRIGYGSDIQAGLKLTGKSGPYSIGVMGVKTGDWKNWGLGNTDKPPDDQWFSIVRVQRDVLGNSNIGFLFTDLEQNPGSRQYLFTRSYSIDWNIYLRPFDTFYGQLVRAENSGKGNNGYAGNVGISHYDQLYYFYVNSYFYDKGFDVNGTGFFQKLPHRGHKEIRLYSEIHPFINRHFIRRWGASVLLFAGRDTEEFHTEAAIQSSIWAETPRQNRLQFTVTRFRQEEVDFLGYSRNLYFNGHDFRLGFNSDPGRLLALKLEGDYGTQYYFQTHSVGTSWGGHATLTLRPLSNWFLEFGYQLRNFLDKKGAYLPEHRIGQNQVNLFTLRGRYLFTKNIFSRGFIQFTNGAEEVGFVQNSRGQYELYYTVFDRLSANLVFGWRFKPGSTTYLVYTEEWDRFSGKSFQSRNRTFFFKISYLLSY